MKKENEVEQLNEEVKELESKLEQTTENLSVLVSEILKKDNEPIVDMTAMDRLEELQRQETEADNWKKAAYMLASDLKGMIELLATNESVETIPVIDSAKESLDKFRSMRLGIDIPTE